MVKQAGHRVLVCWTGTRVVGLDPLTGRLHWEYPTPPKSFIRNCATPVCSGDRLLLSSFFGGSLLLKLRADRLAVEKVWHRVGPNELQTDGLHTNIAEPLIAGDHIYGVDSYGQLRCLAADTGARLWQQHDVVPIRRWSTVRLIPNGANVWLFTDQGELIISRLAPTGYTEISRAKLIKPTRVQLQRRDGVCWAHPAFAHQHVYARNDEELVCASLRAKDP